MDDKNKAAQSKSKCRKTKKSPPGRSTRRFARDTSQPKTGSQPAGPIPAQARQSGQLPLTAAGEGVWISAIRACWAVADQANRDKALSHLRRAQRRRDPKSSLTDVQKALETLRLSDKSIVKLLLNQHLVLASTPPPRPLKGMAAWIRSILGSFDPADSSG